MLMKFAIQDFKDDREFQNLSKQTIKTYQIILGEFQKFCAEKEVLNVEDVTSNIVKSYLLYCRKSKGNNPVTINTKIKNLKAFFNYMVNSDVINEKRNPMLKIEKIKTDTKIEVFSDNHIKQMLGYYRKLKGREHSFYAYRDHTIILTLLGSGMRLGELCNLKWNEIDLISGTIIVFGKNRTQASIPITDKLVKELAEYKVFCQQHFPEPSEYVFINRENKPMTTDAVKNVFKRLKAIMNFKDVRLSAHTFRHTFAHRFLMNGGDVFTLQKMLRHSNLKMTEKYLAIWGTALREQNEKYNPLNSLDV
ncbi:tyrosine-type recombinase/integrase [Metabacillus halosaccharovorans]|uniref:Tyrosine-type recombinase/integrase n=1 Tax=Metabacillus halosaccharovorans TaxID=930124 RepID=A0ABT3DNZ0_9BACI|nr:tyrosine-type recombinase/integrase [Metabacillus halosaccharovorans]MCV9888775.1 tyrosine-type recombinase/integrase [Metabacillus halosaccharovorans]